VALKTCKNPKKNLEKIPKIKKKKISNAMQPERKADTYILF
jgi:hypothetical protein